MYPVLGSKSQKVEIKSRRQYDFEALYTKMLTKENRMLSDAEVRQLPDSFFYTMHRQEWKSRADIVYKFIDYIKRHKGPKKIMDLKCGTGWLGGRLSQLPETEVVAVDHHMNLLEQGAKVFAEEPIRFVYGDIFEPIAELGSFDLIMICDTLMYFPKIEKLFNRCRLYLEPGGQVRLCENPLYYDYSYLYKPSSFGKFFGEKKSPFPWIRIVN